MKKNILIISYAYPPNNVAGAQRPYALAKYLDKFKYNVIVITCKNPDLPLGKNGNFDPNLEGVKILHIKSKVGNIIGNLRQNKNHLKKKSISIFVKSIVFKLAQLFIFPDKAMFWLGNVKHFLKNNPQLIDNADVIFSTSPGVTNHQIALYIKKQKKKIQWIADFRDFNYLENWEEKKGIKPFLHKKLEYNIIKEATNLTFVTNTMLQAYQRHYKSFAHKMLSVYNGFEMEEVNNDASSSVNDQLVFFYAGTFYNGLRSPLPLLQLVDKALEENIIDSSKIKIQIAGNIDEQTKLQMSKYNSYTCIDFLGNLPRTQVLDYMNKSTFLWLIVANIKSHYQTIPIKFYEYMATKRPIINFAPNDAEVSYIIKENQMGFNVNTLDFSLEQSYPLFQEVVSNFIRGDYHLGLECDLISFSWEMQIQKINDLI
jgi:hypothetical protein